MELSVTNIGDVSVACIPGPNLDTSTVGAFKAAVAAALQDSRKLIFDLEEVEFVDSAGLGALLGCLRQFRSLGGEVKLCSPHGAVRLVFDLVRLDKVFEVHRTRDDALAAFGRG